ncbi:MAG: hypothetical protein WBI40_03650 [Methylococcaceae bacterium]
MPALIFEVTPKSGMKPEIVVSDTLIDAMAQIDDIARHEKQTHVFSFRKLKPSEYSKAISDFDADFERIFSH